MFRKRLTAASLVLATTLLGACILSPHSDDAGDASFVRQIVPIMLGRPLRSADEGTLLVDLIDLYDRETVVRMLARKPQFRSHWTNVLVRALELQRDGSRAQEAACFGDPAQIGVNGDGGALAAWVRDHDLTEPFPGALGQIWAPPYSDWLADPDWNFSDLVDSALELDDLSVVFKAYMVPLLTFDGNFERDVGKFFMRTYLDRDLDCTMCHNRSISLSDGDYPRTWPMPTKAEIAVLGCENCSAESTMAALLGIFRRDITAGTGEPGDTRPWGLVRECGTLLGNDFQGTEAIPAQIAGIDTEHEGYPALIDRFQSGVDAIEQYGVPAYGSTPPADRALAYMVAASATEKVWQSIVGSPLTLSHGFARNADQMELHRVLTEELLGSNWSLVDLIVEIVTSNYFNRDAPDHGAGTTAYRLPPVFDAFTVPVDDPDIANEEPCPVFPDPQGPECSNGQGEIVDRYAPVELLTHVQHALGWPRPKRFPGNAYPSLELVASMDGFLSDAQSGSRDWAFQSLIAWEDAAGRCESPDGSDDWIDLLMEEVAHHDAAYPEAPVRVKHVAAAVKDRLLQTTVIDVGRDVDDYTSRRDVPRDDDGGGKDRDPRGSVDYLAGFVEPDPIDDFAGNGGGGDGGGLGGASDDIGTVGPPPTPETELAGIALIFEANYNTPVSYFASKLESRTRRYCGVLLRSPQKVLRGVADRYVFEAASLRVCVEPGAFGSSHPGEPCGYGALCQDYADTLGDLGHHVSCGPGGVSEELPIQILP